MVVTSGVHWHAEWVELTIHCQIVREIGLLHVSGRSVGGGGTTRRGMRVVVAIRERRVHRNRQWAIQAVGSPPHDWDAAGVGGDFKGSVHGGIEVLVSSLVGGHHEMARSLAGFVGGGGLIRVANVIWMDVGVAIVVGLAKEAVCERVVQLGQHGRQLWSSEDSLMARD